MSQNESSNFRSRRNTTRQSAPTPGVQSLNKAAHKAVQEKGDEIAAALSQASVNGNVSSARLLCQLAENAQWAEDEDVMSPVLELALKWENEPEWVPPPLTPPAGDAPVMNAAPAAGAKPDAD